MAGDLRFIQNRAIAFTITLHDPSEYLNDADITFNWDFGDGSGALISRELTVTHTYVDTGSFKPKVVVQAVIPDKACDVPVNTTKAPGPPSGGGSTGKPNQLSWVNTYSEGEVLVYLMSWRTQNSAKPAFLRSALITLLLFGQKKLLRWCLLSPNWFPSRQLV